MDQICILRPYDLYEGRFLSQPGHHGLARFNDDYASAHIIFCKPSKIVTLGMAGICCLGRAVHSDKRPL